MRSATCAERANNTAGTTHERGAGGVEDQPY
jgi:hypothetical protein